MRAARCPPRSWPTSASSCRRSAPTASRSAPPGSRRSRAHDPALRRHDRPARPPAARRHARPIDSERIVEVRRRTRRRGDRSAGHYIVPGFIDVHVHGVEGIDTLDGGDAIARIAARLPRYGVTAFCPTSIACAPAALRRHAGRRSARRARRRAPASARVLPAHLESNFINPEFKGAQPRACLRTPRDDAGRGRSPAPRSSTRSPPRAPTSASSRVAPEIDGVLELIPRPGRARSPRLARPLGRDLRTGRGRRSTPARGRRRTCSTACRRSATAQPGLAGAVLDSDEVVAEIVCDGVHVHPAVVRVAVAAKSPSRVMAITDGTAGSGLPRGANGHPRRPSDHRRRRRLPGRRHHRGQRADDGSRVCEGW